MRKQPLLNTYVNNVSMEEVLSEISQLIEKRKKSYVVEVNTDVIIKIESDSYLKRIVDEATLTLVDGKPLIWIAKLWKCPVKEKVSGSDMVPMLCKMAEEKGYSIFLIGGEKGIPDKAKGNLQKAFPKIRVKGAYSPPFGFEDAEIELNKINHMISDANPDIVFACLGCPKQEKWVYENYEKYEATVSICAGATVDFLAGKVKRAPQWMSEHGLEWFYRFLREPRRLFRRYFVEDIKIMKVVKKYWRGGVIFYHDYFAVPFCSRRCAV